jgi:EAL domain-containing protein (putative c-di-GMP-specific phosphodiesterase class I)/DNA-binding NarL/FixJ family response regulator
MTRAKEIRILIAEDDPAVRDALAALINLEPNLKIVASAVDADEAIAAAEGNLPDVAIVDVRMPGGGGVRAAREIKLRCPETKVIALSASDDRATVLEMLEAGVVGYLVKGDSVTSIVESIKRASTGHASLSVEVTRDVIDELVQELVVRRRGEEKLQLRRDRVRHAIDDKGALDMALQPICALDGCVVVGAEALARFRGPPKRGPDRWFAEASEVGLRAELELAAVRTALERLADLKASIYLSINVSPATVCSAAFRRLFAKEASDRIVIEITEHAPVADYDRLNTNLASIRKLGVRLAIDDAGAGFASLRHILRLEPDFIKLDTALIAGIAEDTSQQALAAGLISFSDKIGATLVAEGIERPEEVAALRALGVRYGQGFYLGRPARELSLTGASHAA